MAMGFSSLPPPLRQEKKAVRVHHLRDLQGQDLSLRLCLSGGDREERKRKLAGIAIKRARMLRNMGSVIM